jgi:putative PIG3 family NAD(P)H quinone oxidoreductase
VLIEMAAAGVNRPDVMQRKGAYAPPPGTSDIPGLELAGRIAVLGEGVQGFALGQEVTALVAGGGYAEFCTAPAPQCLPVPRGLSLAEAGALPETYFTVWSNVFDRGRLQPGERFLVHGGTSGIGTTAIQLAHAFGATVYATAGTPEKVKACEALGAARAIDYRREDFVAVINETSGGKGVDVVLDMVGAPYIAKDIELLAPEGRLLLLSFLGGAKAEIDFAPVMVKRLTITGSTLRPRPVAFKGAIAQALKEKVWPLLEQGKAKPILYKTFPLAEAAEAHRLMESSQHIGKIVLVRP